MSDNVWSAETGPSGLPPEKVEILRELNESFKGDRRIISAYLTKFGWSKVIAANIRIIKRELAETDQMVNEALGEGKAGGAGPLEPEEILADDAANTGLPVRQAGTGDAERSPYYSIEVSCLYCDTRIRADVLRSKALIMTYLYKNPLFPLMVPEAKSAMKGFRLEDPLRRSVIVCPNCFYANSSPAYFSSEASNAAGKGIAKVSSRKMPALRKAVSDDREARAELYRSSTIFSDDSSVGGTERQTRQAIITFRLAARCSGLLVEFDSASAWQAAEALLSAAKLTADLAMPAEEEMLLKEAAAYLDTFFQAGSVSALTVYLLGVLQWHLGNSTAARTWIGKLLTDRGELAGASRYRRYAENLRDTIREA